MILPAFILIFVSLLIGLHGATRIAGRVRNFYVAGNIIPTWVLALSLIGQAIESGSTYGNASHTMTDGFWAGAVSPIGIGLSLLMIGLFFAEPLHKMRILTLGDFYQRTYGTAVGTMASLLCVASFIILLASNFAGVGIVLHYFVPLSADVLGVAVAVVIMVYVIAGGLFAATWNDILHTGVKTVGCAAALAWLISANPDIASAAFHKGFSWAPLHDRSQGALSNWAALIALGIGDVVALDFMERVFAAKTPRHARAACLTAGVATIVTGIAIAVIGMIAGARAAASGVGSNDILAFVDKGLPAGVGMMLMMMLVAAPISCADGVLMATSSVMMRNVIQANFPHLVPANRLLLYSRFFLVPVTILACVLAIVKPDPGDLLILSFELVLAGCFVPLVLGIYWKKANARAAFWAIMIPSILRVVLYFALPADIGWIGTLLPPLVSLAIFVAFASGKSPAAALEAPANA